MIIVAGVDVFNAVPPFVIPAPFCHARAPFCHSRNPLLSFPRKRESRGMGVGLQCLGLAVDAEYHPIAW